MNSKIGNNDAETMQHPTPEQHRHARYVEEYIVDQKPGGKAVRIGHAYRKKPRFEKIEGVGTAQLKAMRVYRSLYENSDRSEMRCALDVRPGGGGGSDAALTAMELYAFSRDALATIERDLKGASAVMRDVVLLDLTFSDVAMKRYGSREVDYIITGKGKQKPRSVVKIVPKSGAHREAVRQEFFAGLALLLDAVKPFEK